MYKASILMTMCGRITRSARKTTYDI